MALPWHDVQGNIYPGFKKDHQAFLFVRFPGSAPDLQARAWLNQIRLSIAAADEVEAFNALYKIVHTHRPGRESEAVRATWVNVGFSYPGLQKLDTLSLLDFPDAFTEGMHERHMEIGDEDSELPTWIVGGSDATLPDAIVAIAADVQADLDAEIANQRSALTANGLSEMALCEGHSLGGGREHFGFRDGVTDPKPVEAADVSTSPDNVLYTEFVLGLGPFTHGPDPEPPAWTENGSYMVFRRLYQNVAGFHERAVTAAAELSPLGGTGGITLNGPYVEAKFVGRWQDGTPVGTSPTPPPPGPIPDITAMDYVNDKTGMKIPRFSHIRKGHPRDLGKDDAGNDMPGADRPEDHRLIRRGITYGSPLPAGNPDDGCDRGLLFVGYQASLAEQFEFIASQWLNRRTFPPLRSGVGSPTGSRSIAGEDPIVGTNDNDEKGPRLIVYPTKTVPVGGSVNLHTQDLDLERFVKMTGGGYFFCPGIAALADLAGGTTP